MEIVLEFPLGTNVGSDGTMLTTQWFVVYIGT